jgi:hemerythrin-like metal-binding protein
MRLHQPLFIKWQEYNNTGIELIDDQHKGIVSIINTFYHLMGLGVGNHKLYLCIVDTIKTYSSIHFLTEEGLLAAAEYQYLENHKELHKKLIHELERIEHNDIRINDRKPLLDFLKTWWIAHINEQDQRYVQHVRASGEARPKN